MLENGKEKTSCGESDGKIAAVVATKHSRDDSHSSDEEIHALEQVLVVIVIMIVLQRPSIGNKFEFIGLWIWMMKNPWVKPL